MDFQASEDLAEVAEMKEWGRITGIVAERSTMERILRSILWRTRRAWELGLFARGRGRNLEPRSSHRGNSPEPLSVSSKHPMTTEFLVTNPGGTSRSLKFPGARQLSQRAGNMRKRERRNVCFCSALRRWAV